MKLLSVGKQAPDFELPDQKGKKHKLSDYLGKWVLVYFYPKDNTPGCTKEACAIRDDYSAFKRNNIVALGISADSVKRHEGFASKYKLPFTLLSDENKKAIKLYKAWGKKKMMGREYNGIFRASYLIDPKGKIAKVYEKVKPIEHAQEVLHDVKALKKN